MISITNYNKQDFSTIPEEGWLKPCYSCSTITSRYILINELNKYYFCRNCERKKKYLILKLYYGDEFEYDFN